MSLGYLCLMVFQIIYIYIHMNIYFLTHFLNFRGWGGRNFQSEISRKKNSRGFWTITNREIAKVPLESYWISRNFKSSSGKSCKRQLFWFPYPVKDRWSQTIFIMFRNKNCKSRINLFNHEIVFISYLRYWTSIKL